MVIMTTATKVAMVIKIKNNTPFYDSIPNGASIDATLQVCLTTILLLLMVGNCEVRF
jgi:hypothetical protein